MGQRIHITRNEHLIVTLHETEHSSIYRDFLDEEKNVGMTFFIKHKLFTESYVKKFEIKKIWHPAKGIYVAGFDSCCTVDFGTYLYVVEAYNKITDKLIKVVAVGHIDILPDILLDKKTFVTHYYAPKSWKKGEEYESTAK